ncbi:MAG: RNA-binding S4 domain-containing protein [Paludibacteraceae bacterium]|nr:RNA-binding S4 domain-containing protein [Paludibacteraceae bacterium]
MEERIDKYLFAMRIYKTRSIAADACKNGRVKMNGTELKPSRTFHVGDVFTVRKGPVTYTYKVLALSANRLGAKLVPEYLQDITTPDQLEVLQLARLAAQSGRDRGTGRPTKKDRRDIETFISDDYDPTLDWDEDDEE